MLRRPVSVTFHLWVVTEHDETPERRSEYYRLVNPHASCHKAAENRIYIGVSTNNVVSLQNRPPAAGDPWRRDPPQGLIALLALIAHNLSPRNFSLRCAGERNSSLGFAFYIRA
jgi:hypothetical protein